jgi:hypothetical protein
MSEDQFCMAQVISSHPAWQHNRDMPIVRGNLVWPTTCNHTWPEGTEMADFTRELSQEYWRHAPSPGNQFQPRGFQTHGTEEFCATCGTQYSAGARFCHLCGLGREEDLPVAKQSAITDWLGFEHIREHFELSTTSLVLVLAAALFMLATVMTGLVYNTSTIAEWQAVQTWRIEWLLAAVVALLAAMLFKTKP